jgi:hypothetical protein
MGQLLTEALDVLLMQELVHGRLPRP